MTTHDQLKKVCLGMKDYLNRLEKDRPISDCSCGCIHFHPLDGAAGNDWGVCTNKKAKRAGLLTFEHMGCKHFCDTILCTYPEGCGSRANGKCMLSESCDKYVDPTIV